MDKAARGKPLGMLQKQTETNGLKRIAGNGAKSTHETKRILSFKYSLISPYFCGLEFYVRTNISYRIMRTTWNRVG